MKKTLSLILTLLITLGAFAVFPAFAAADGAAQPEGLKAELEEVTVDEGTEVAYLGLYVSATALPDSYERLRDWQFAFDGATLAGEYERKFVVTIKERPTPAKYPRGQNKPRILPL